MIVISKLDYTKNKNPFMMDYERQVFYEFDKIKSEALGEQVEYYKVFLDADKDFTIVATDSELKYFNENKEQIKKLKDRARKKEEEMCGSVSDNAFNVGIPLPNPNH